MAKPNAHHYHPMVRTLAKALKQRCGIHTHASILIACSGGADSVALLQGLALLAPRRNWQLQLTVGHIQHHLRAEAEDDAQFVQALADRLGLPYARRDIAPANTPGNLEANAREQRYAALADIAHQANATYIATAHHADDQLETLLMRLLRGTSVAGLRGIAWHQPLTANGSMGKDVDKRARDQTTGPVTLIRPMLAVEQADLLSFLAQLNQPWREDATNADTSRTRAKLRHEVLPLLKQIQPDAAAKANELAEHFTDLHQLVQQSAAAALEDQTFAKQRHAICDPPSPCFCLLRQQARTLNPAVLTEIIRRGLLAAGAPADQLSRHALRPAIDAARDTVGGTRTFCFSNHIRLVISREMITLALL